MHSYNTERSSATVWSRGAHHHIESILSRLQSERSVKTWDPQGGDAFGVSMGKEVTPGLLGVGESPASESGFLSVVTCLSSLQK